jgi:hypothetical protein
MIFNKLITIQRKLSYEILLLLSLSPLLRLLITLSIILIMRIYFINIVYAEGIPYQAFESELYKADVKVGFIDREEKAVAENAVLQAYLDYKENQSIMNRYRLTQRSQELAIIEHRSIIRAIEHAKKLLEEKAAYNERLNTTIESMENVQGKPESSNDAIRRSLKVPIETTAIKSNIGGFLQDLQENDPKQVKTILSWYQGSGFCLSQKMNHCTNEYRKFLTDFGKLCYTSNIVIGDLDTIGFLVIGSYHTQDTELYNIARAYIHLAFYNEDINNGVNMTNEVITSQFNKATLKLDETYEYLRNRDDNNH